MGAHVVLISGGSRGLGAVIARRCLDMGHVVATFSRSASPFVEEQRRLDPLAMRFHWASVDSRDDRAVARFLNTVVERYGGVDTLVNNAAVGRFGLFPLMSLAHIDETLQINLRSNILLARLCTPSMVARVCSEPGVMSSCVFTLRPFAVAWRATDAARVMSS